MRHPAYVYLITNKLNGKQYVGFTTRAVSIRWKEHCEGSKGALHAAIRKYGVESFEVETVFQSEELDLALVAEEIWIEELDTLVPNGYNIREGGYEGGFPKGRRKPSFNEEQLIERRFKRIRESRK